jgi:hypothetical protein
VQNRINHRFSVLLELSQNCTMAAFLFPSPLLTQRNESIGIISALTYRTVFHGYARKSADATNAVSMFGATIGAAFQPIAK